MCKIKKINRSFREYYLESGELLGEGGVWVSRQKKTGNWGGKVEKNERGEAGGGGMEERKKGGEKLEVRKGCEEGREGRGGEGGERE